MKDWMKEILLLAEQDREGVLITVAAARGSVPRGPGAHLVLTEQSMRGTIGGGSVEQQAIARAKQLLLEKTPGLMLTYLAGGGLSVQTIQGDAQQAAESVHRIEGTDPAGHLAAGMHAQGSAAERIDTGMICGGELTVLMQYLDGSSTQVKRLAENLRRYSREASVRKEESPCLVLEQRDGQDLAEVLWLAQTTDILFYPELPGGQTGWQYMESLSCGGRVFIFGAGHVAGELAPLLDRLDFPCVVCDCREELLQKPAFREARTVCTGYENAVVFQEIGPEDSICIMSHGHEHDYVLLTQALQTPAAYIGVLGSRRKQAILRERLLADGFSQEDLTRYQLPMGIEIGSDSPAEIAVSIAAELIRRRSEKPGGGI